MPQARQDRAQEMIDRGACTLEKEKPGRGRVFP
jgi:hypothetical protein